MKLLHGHEEYGARIHGSYAGHVLPAVMFLVLATWWAINIFARYSSSSKSRRKFTIRTWYLWKWFPTRLLEPWLKIILPGFGILVELRLGHKAWRHVVGPDGHIVAHSLNNWQHAVMYGSVCLSGCVDLLGYYSQQLPAGTEQAFLSLAFLIQGILMAFHLKGAPLEWILHLLLTFIMFACFVTSVLEVRFPNSVLLTTCRSMAVFFQGTWFIQIAHILYLGNPAWDINDDGPVMLVPVVFCLHMLLIATGYLIVFAIVLAYHNRSASTNPLLITKAPEASAGSLASDAAEAAETKVLIAKEYSD